MLASQDAAARIALASASVATAFITFTNGQRQMHGSVVSLILLGMALLVSVRKTPEVFAVQKSTQVRPVFSDKNIKNVEKYLEGGADPNQVFDGQTALHLAASDGQVKVIKLLIKHGADFTATDRAGRTPLECAIGWRNTKSFKVLLDAGAKPDDSMLGLAGWLGLTDIVKLLLDAGVDPDAGIVRASQGGHTEIVTLLLERGANVNTKGSGDITPLHTAALQGSLETVRLLLEKGADPNALNDRFQTPLHMAISGDGKLEKVQFLVRAGAKLDPGDEEGVTPMRLASIRGNKPIYQWLLTVVGGKEPRVVLLDSQRSKDKSIADLVAQQSSRDRPTRLAAKRELVARGKLGMPEILQTTRPDVFDGQLYDLFVTMGPEAESALPILEPQLAKKDQVWPAMRTIESVKPGSVAALGDATKVLAAAALYEAIVDPKADVMEGLYASSLVQLTAPATPTILRVLRHPKPRHRGIMVECLETRFPDEEIDAELLKMSRNEPHLDVRARAAGALGTEGDLGAQARSVLLDLVKSPRPNQTPSGVSGRLPKALARFGPSVIDDLMSLLSSPENPRRNTAIAVLRSIGPPAIPRLIQLLGHQNDSVATAAAIALHQIGIPAVSALSRAIKDENTQVVERAANSLWWIGLGAKDALPTLVDIAGAKERPDRARLAAVRAAVKIDSARVHQSIEMASIVAMLIRVLKDGEFLQQGQAAETLGGIGPPARDALPALHELLKAPPPVDPMSDSQLLVRNVKAAIEAIETPDDE